MYKSPVNIYEAADNIRMQIIKQQNEDIYRAVLSYGIAVDKEELLRALKYDRDQYNKGHLDGYTDAMASIVRCKDCKHSEPCGESRQCLHPFGLNACDGNDFCSYGERKEE